MISSYILEKKGILIESHFHWLHFLISLVNLGQRVDCDFTCYSSSFWLLKVRQERAEAKREKPVVAVTQEEMVVVVVAVLRKG